MNTLNTDLVPSVSIDNLLAQRDAIVERIRGIRGLLNEAQALAIAALGASPHSLNLTIYGLQSYQLDDDRGVARMIKVIDAEFWATLLDKSGLKTFLDAEAREKWREAVENDNVPELTYDNIAATFKHLYASRGDMFERGVVAVFRALSWDYKTNCPRMFGKRVILTHMVDTWGGSSKYLSGVSHNGANKLDDLVRVFSVLEGKPEPDHRSAAWRALHDLGWMKDRTNVRDADLTYFSLRGFKNGNAHLTFKRLDLVTKMNQILAKHYPGALPPSSEDA